MPKFRVSYDVRNPRDTGGTSGTKVVEADSDYMAAKLAEAQYFKANPHSKGYSFIVRAVQRA